MATATTIPEFFSNTISTFFADSDMGLNAIIGSTLFNTLGVAASASLFVPRPVQIDYWPITRDSMLFSLNIIALLIISWDGYVTWWETGILVFLYIFYWIIMFQNKRIVKIVKYYIEEKLMWCQRIKNYDIANQRPKIIVESKQVEPVKTTQYGTIVESYKQIDVENYKTQDFVSRTDLLSVLTEHDKDDDAKSNLFHYPSEKSGISQFWFILTWPMRIILKYTIPDPVRHKNLFMLSFVMCIIWIGCVTFMVFWMTVLVGDTFNIPDNVMGLTFLGFGGCMPEAISAVIVARRGSGQMVI
jgi:solute carrier family 24 (sodium/potassium/calcium exchanger), member 4